LALSTTAISGHPNLITKAKFPRQIFPLSFIAVGIIDLSINLLICWLLTLIQGSWHPASILIQGMSLLALFLLTVSMGLVFSALNVYFRDFKYIVPILIQLMFFVTPVFYSLDILPTHIAELITWNPLTPIIQGLQSPLSEPTLSMAYPLISSLILLELASVLFDRLNEKMADII